MSRTATLRHTLIASLITIGSILLLQACGGGGKNPPPPAPIPSATGYYTNTGTLTVQDNGGVARTDLQAMINGTRFIMMSVQAGLIYDGTITLTGNTFTGTLSVYTNGINPATTTVSGTLNQGIGITGTLTGTGAGSGTFSLNYTAASNLVSNINRVAETQANPTWTSFIGGSTSNLEFILANDGTTANATGPTDGNFIACRIVAQSNVPEDRFTAVSGTSLYSVRVKMTVCNPTAPLSTNVGDYTGLAASRSDLATDDTLVLVITSANGAFSVGGDFK